jgi:hypothetical protein
VTVRNAARAQKTVLDRQQARRSESVSKVIHPGKLVVPDMELLRQQAEALSLVAGISSLLFEVAESRPVAYPAAPVRLTYTPTQPEANDPELLLEQARLLAPVHDISSLLSGLAY